MFICHYNTGAVWPHALPILFFVCHEIFVTLKCPLLSPFSDKSLERFRFSMSWLFNPRGLDYLSTWSRGVIIPTRQRQVNARQKNPLAVSSNPGQLAVCRIKWGCWIRGHALNFNKILNINIHSTSVLWVSKNSKPIQYRILL